MPLLFIFFFLIKFLDFLFIYKFYLRVSASWNRCRHLELAQRAIAWSQRGFDHLYHWVFHYLNGNLVCRLIHRLNSGTNDPRLANKDDHDVPTPLIKLLLF